MKKNQDLKIEFLSQENDRDLLIRQIIYNKKQHKMLKSNFDKLG